MPSHMLSVHTRTAGSNMLPPDGQEAAKGPQETPAQRNLRLLKEIEDEEEAFQRKTTKLAMEMARVESDKVMSKTVTVEAFAKQMHEKMEALQATFTQEIEQGRKREDALQAQLASVMTENKRLALTVEEVLKEQKVAAKHRNDLEEAIFYLQDEILKTKPKPPPTPQIDPKTAAKKKK